jgi:hypothetical protein
MATGEIDIINRRAERRGQIDVMTVHTTTRREQLIIQLD